MRTVQWLVQSTVDHPDLAAGVPPADLLHESERDRLAALATPKRRHDWLLGRWTAKHLLQVFLDETTGSRPPLHAIVICNNADGVPLVGLSLGSDEPFRPVRVALSISHCETVALAAVSAAAMRPDELFGSTWEEAAALASIGADIERIRPRAWNFVEDYYTAAEVARVSAAPEEVRDLLVTAIWSAKEAALKAVQLGLSVDTRRVECDIEADLAEGRAWQSFAIRFRPEPAGPEKEIEQTLAGWWRRMDDYVLTLASRQAADY